LEFKSALKIVGIVLLVTLWTGHGHTALAPDEHEKFINKFREQVDTRLEIVHLETEQGFFCWFKELLGGGCTCSAHYQVTRVVESPTTLTLAQGDRIELAFPCRDGKFSWVGSFLPWGTKEGNTIHMAVRQRDLVFLKPGVWRLDNHQRIFVPILPE